MSPGIFLLQWQKYYHVFMKNFVFAYLNIKHSSHFDEVLDSGQLKRGLPSTAVPHLSLTSLYFLTACTR